MSIVKSDEQYTHTHTHAHKRLDDIFPESVGCRLPTSNEIQWTFIVRNAQYNGSCQDETSNLRHFMSVTLAVVKISSLVVRQTEVCVIGY